MTTHAAPREGSFDHGGVRYRYLAWSSAASASCETASRAAATAPYVLVHGFAQSAATWGRAASLLAEDRPVYAIDLVGHGGSQVPHSPLPYVLSAQGETLLAFVAHIQQAAALPDCLPQGKAHAGQPDAAASVRARRAARAPKMKPIVVGYSMGGRVALAALRQDPQAFGALVLESAGLGPATAAERGEAAVRDAENARRLREAGLVSFMDSWEQLPLFASQRSLSRSVRARVRAGRLANDAEALARTFEHAGQHAMPDRDEVLRLLEQARQQGMTVLYVAGSRDEKYQGIAQQLQAAGVDARVVPRAGHNVHLEAPAPYAHLLHAEFG